MEQVKETVLVVEEISALDKLINWVDNTKMEQISIGMLQDWFKELKEHEEQWLEKRDGEWFKNGFETGQKHAMMSLNDSFKKLCKQMCIEPKDL